MKGEHCLLIFVILCILLVLIIGCDKITNCSPDGKLEKNKKDFYLGFKCEGKF